MTKRAPILRLPAFTLLEVMVATMIVGVSFGAICCVMAQATRSADVTGRYSRAAILAQSKLDELVLRGKLNVGREQGKFRGEPGYTWRLRVDPAEEKGMVKVKLTVAFAAPGGKRRVVLHTLRADRSLPKKADTKTGNKNA